MQKYYVGIDVSKPWLDVAVMAVMDHRKQPMECGRFDNTVQGIRAFNKWLNKHKDLCGANCLVLIENTGLYHRLIWEYCSDHALPLYIGNATDLKWSMGIVRDKNDQADSCRLCQYAFRHADKVQATPALDAALLVLKDLVTSRSRLLNQINSIKVYLGEVSNFNSKAVQKMMAQSHKAALKGLQQSLQAIEKEISTRVKENEAIKTNYELLQSIPGIGPLTAVYLVCCTANFSGSRTGKQLACYAGVVPFSQSSGKSIKGRPRVHKMANKELKRMLHMCAMSAIRKYPEFRDYYERKTAQGKHPLAVLNAIKNKLALRAVAVIKNQSPYVDNYKKTA
jgi:transposase